MPANSKSNLSYVTLVLLGLTGLVLAWEITSYSLAAALSDSLPRLALSIDVDNTEAMLDLADDALNLKRGGTVPTDEPALKLSAKGQALFDSLRAKGIPAPIIAPEVSDSTRAQVRKYAQTALLKDPLNSRALRALGLTADNDEDALTFMEAAGARSKHDSLTLYWLLQQAFLRVDYAKAAEYGDLLLRSQIQYVDLVAPILARVYETKAGAEPITALILSDPPWRRAFFEAMIPGISDARTPLNLMLELQQHGLQPTQRELTTYLNFLMKLKFYELAYYAWVQFLPPEQVANLVPLYNGQFDQPISGMPFDWVFVNGSGMRIEIVDHPDTFGAYALLLEFIDGQVDVGAVKQIVALQPGKYSLAGSYKGNVQARRGLRWQVACIDAQGVPLAGSDDFVGSVSSWVNFSMAFTVPAQKCPAQLLWLELDARTASERIVSGSAWFADLSVTKVP